MQWILKSSLFGRLLETRTVKNSMFQAWMLKNRLFNSRVPTSDGEYLQRLGDGLKSSYDGHLDIWTDMPGEREPARWFFARLPSGPHNVLDIGTGRGRDLDLFLEADGGTRATGLELFEIDNWPEMRLRWGDRLKLSVTPFLKFDPDEKFTAILTTGALHHQHPAEYEAFLAHVRELLAPGGHFLVGTLHQKSERPPGPLLYTDERYWRFFTTEELRELLTSAGFRWVDSFSHHDSFFPTLSALVTH